MPNWVQNTVIATNGDTDKLIKLLVNEKRNIDFNRVIPMPSDLNITAGSMSYRINYTVYSKEEFEKQEKLINPMLSKFYNEELTQSEFVNKVITSLTNSELNTFKSVYEISEDTEENRNNEFITNIIKGYYNTQKYGYPDWYEWSIANWGTKWNACQEDTYDADITGDKLCFSTAWSCPLEVLLAVSKQVPVTVAYADEDMGNNYGILLLENGEIKEVITQNNGSIGEAICIHGYESVDDYMYNEDWEDQEDYEQALEDFEKAEKVMEKYGLM